MMYRAMQVYNMVLMDWLVVVGVTVPFGGCLGVILTLYVTLRPGDIPLIIYPCFPLVGFCTQTVITALLMNGRSTKGKADDVLSNLQMGMYSQWMMRFDPLEKKICMRRLKSLRPVSIRVGVFAETTFEVTMNVWDEICNQLLFLLSL